MAKEIDNKLNNEHELISINSSKNLFYLKYDNNFIYVSSVKNIYKCHIQNLSCEVFIDDLGSARGLFIYESFLFIADYKNKQILRKSIIESNDNISVVINESLTPNLGNVFQLALFKQTLIWSEFSGVVKSINGKNESSILFQTFDEYVYSVTLMSIEIEQEDLSFRDIYDDYVDFIKQGKDNHQETTSILSYLLSILMTTDSYKEMTSTRIIETNETTDIRLLDSSIKLTTSYSTINAVSLQTNVTIAPLKLNETNSTSHIQINFKKANELETNETKFDLGLNISSNKSKPLNNKYFYLVSFLLCFSVFLNILLLYLNSIKRQKGELVIQNRNLDLIETNSH